MYSGDQFKKDYLDYNFDEMLLERNNPLVTSNEKFLFWKNMYLKDTLDNYNRLTKLLADFSNDNYSVTRVNNTTQYIYTYSNQNVMSTFNLEIKSLLATQKKMFKHFVEYIEFLNSSNS